MILKEIISMIFSESVFQVVSQMEAHGGLQGTSFLELFLTT